MEIKGDKGNTFYDADYPISDNFVYENTKAFYTVTFKAVYNSKTGGIYYVRLLK